MFNRILMNDRQILPTFDTAITVLNRLKSKDSVTKQDVWYATIIPDCDWTQETIRNVSGNTVSVGGAYKTLIPKQANYLPYNEWKSKPDGNLTFTEGDFVIKGVLDFEEIPTPNTIQKIYQNHRPQAFQIKSFKDLTGIIELAEHYEIEGA